jgi:hypothetical protein
VGAPVGPTGCNAPKKSETEAGASTEDKVRGIQITAGYGRFWSHLKFADDSKPTLTEQSVIGQVGYFFSRNLSLTAVGGAILSGTMYLDGPDLDVGTGFVVSMHVAWQFLDQKAFRPFMSGSLTASYSRAPFDDGQGRTGFIWGTDVRLGWTVGYTFFHFWSVYLSPRVFGGPVFIDEGDTKIQGRDRYFVQAGMGMAFMLPKGITIYVDGSPAGEQAISAGLAWFLPVGGRSDAETKSK